MCNTCVPLVINYVCVSVCLCVSVSVCVDVFVCVCVSVSTFATHGCGISTSIMVPFSLQRNIWKLCVCDWGVRVPPTPCLAVAAVRHCSIALAHMPPVAHALRAHADTRERSEIGKRLTTVSPPPHPPGLTPYPPYHALPLGKKNLALLISFFP